ncbi:MAG: hypothetical protein DYG89_12085 [Caldilinea sp. CFX5]|nr:hypothetical protein [Caldilinea sp. CFX5]
MYVVAIKHTIMGAFKILGAESIPQTNVQVERKVVRVVYAALPSLAALQEILLHELTQPQGALWDHYDVHYEYRKLQGETSHLVGHLTEIIVGAAVWSKRGA